MTAVVPVLAPRRHLLLGGPGTGKTERLANHVAELIAGGAAASDIWVFAASPDAAALLEQRIVRACGATAGRGVRVGTPRLMALEVLGTPAARRITGRDALLLANFETSMLMEDVKTSGVRPKRLKEMLRFFYRSWTELADRDPAWLVSDEEITVHGLVKECLAATRGVLEPEVANLAVGVLGASAETRGAFGRPHVVADDYQMLSRASQQLVGMLARETLWVAGDALACAEVYDSYPFGEGLEEFATSGECVVERLETCHRSRASLASARSIAEQFEGPDPVLKAGPAVEEGSRELLVLDDPVSERACVAQAVAEAIAAGTAPEAVYVAVPNRSWSCAVEAELAARGIASTTAFDARALNGDIRDDGRCAPARIATLLMLAADPANDVAWRSWCGFGDWLANSCAFAALRDAARVSGVTVHELLAAGVRDVDAARPLGADEKAALGRVFEAAQRGRSWSDEVRTCAGGEAALRLACRLVLGTQEGPEFQMLAALCSGPDGRLAGTLADLVGRMRANLAAPCIGAAPGAVRMGSLAQLAAQEPEVAVVSGFVNGFLPRHAYFDETQTSPDRRASWRQADLRRLYAAVAKPAKSLVVTAFRTVEAARAERLDLKADRIVMRNGARIARVSPSVFASDMGLEPSAR